MCFERGLGGLQHLFVVPVEMVSPSTGGRSCRHGRGVVCLVGCLGWLGKVELVGLVGLLGLVGLVGLLGLVG